MREVLIVNLHYKTGGIKKTLQDLVRELKGVYNISVMFLCEPADYNELDNITVISSPFLIDSYLSSIDELKTKTYYPIRLIVKCLFKVLSRFFGQKRILYYLIKLSKKIEADIAISYTHDIWWPNGYFSGGSNDYVRMNVKAKRKVAWIHGEPHTIGLNQCRAKDTYQGFDYIVNVSKACKREFDTMYPDSSKSVYIRNLFDVDGILKKAKENIDINTAGTTFVTVARLSSSAKRVDKVNEIAFRLKTAGKNFNWYVVGGGPEFDSYVLRSKELGVDDCVHYVGQQNNPYKFIYRSNLIVVPSDSESYGLVLIEGLICGKPVVTTNFDAAYEIIEDGVTGFVTEKDVESIYKSLLLVLSNPQMLNILTENVSHINISNDESLTKIKQIFEE